MKDDREERVLPKTLEQITRAYEVLDHIERHPEKHDQDSWVSTLSSVTAANLMVDNCGTTACFAGWTALLAGGRIEGAMVRLPADPWAAYLVNFAQRLLGLTDEEELTLFHKAQDLADVRKAVFEIFGPRPDGAP